MKVALLGGSGFVGTALAAGLETRGDEPIIVLLRNPYEAAGVAAPRAAIVKFPELKAALRDLLR